MKHRKDDQQAPEARPHACGLEVADSPDLVLWFDAGLRLVAANRAARKFFLPGSEASASSNAVVDGPLAAEMELPGEFVRQLGSALVAGRCLDGVFSLGASGKCFSTIITPLRNEPENGEGPVLVAVNRPFALSPEDSVDLERLADARMRALLEAESKYQEVIQAAPWGFFQTTVSGRLLVANQALASMFGYTDPEEIIETLSSMEDLYVDPKQRAVFLRHVEEMGWVSGFELKLRRRDGALLWILVHARAVRDAGGEILCIEGTMENITRRKAVERQLREQLSFFETLVETIPNPVFYQNSAGVFLGCNKSFEIFMHRRKKEIVGRTAGEVFPEETAAFQREEFSPGQDPAEVSEIVLPDPLDRSERHVILNRASFRDAEGDEAGRVGVMLDITDLRKAQEVLACSKDQLESQVRERTETLREANVTLKDEIGRRRSVERELRRERNLLARIMETSPMGVVMTDVSGEIVFANAMGELVLGLERRENRSGKGAAYDRPDWGLTALEGEPLAEAELPFRLVSGSRAPVFDLRYRLLRGDGSEVFLSVNGSPLFGEGETMEGVVFTVEDISRRILAEQGLKRSEARFRTMFENSPVIMWLDDFSEVGDYGKELARQGVTDFEAHFREHPEEALECARRVRILDVNQTALDFYGARDKQELMDKLPQVLGENQVFGREMAAYLTGKPTYVSETVNVTLAGEPKDLIVHWTVLPGRDEASQVLVSLVDITERKKMEEDLRLAAEVLKSSGEAIVITDTGGRIIEVNRAYTVITGFDRGEVLGCLIRLLDNDLQDGGLRSAVWDELGRTGMWEGEVWDRRRNGEAFPKWLTISAVTDDTGATTHYVGVFRDITQAKQAEENLQQLAHYDTLTGLPNRLLLRDRLEQAMRYAVRHGEFVGLMFLDLDRFKIVNDTLGHGAGDELLQGMARRLESGVRKSDTVARLGGDEFLVIMPGLSDSAELEQPARKLLETLARPFDLGGNEVYVTGSIGVVTFPEDGRDFETLLKNADLALYHAKEQGKNTFKFFSEDLNDKFTDRLKMEAGLRRALTGGEFFLHYQPKVDLADGSVVGVEALLRWRHPELGSLLPGAFIALAEETGLIWDIGLFVLREACEQAVAWHKTGLAEITMAVNLSARQFQDERLALSVERVLAESGLPAHLLELEVTETAIMQGGTQIMRTLERLREQGVRLAIDDFGTGYSSLSYLKRFPIDALKIDKSFVLDIPEDLEDAAIAEAVIVMAHSLSMQVVAEGVETREQLRFLRERGCDMVQGYHLQRPASGDEIGALLAVQDEVRRRVFESGPFGGAGCDTGEEA